MNVELELARLLDVPEHDARAEAAAVRARARLERLADAPVARRHPRRRTALVATGLALGVAGWLASPADAARARGEGAAPAGPAPLLLPATLGTARGVRP